MVNRCPTPEECDEDGCSGLCTDIGLDMDTWDVRCDVCGRFISVDDLQIGRARHVLLTPDSEFTKETYESLCHKHNLEEYIVGP
jgi:hypothetical protein